MPNASIMSNRPTVFNPAKDLLALHYDCSPDPDDFTSSAADRALLEATFGTAWLPSHVLPAIGTYGRNTAYKEESCERVAQAVWGDSTGYLRAAANNASHRALAVEYARERWAHTLAAGGQVYVKEGGQSDFTKDVVSGLEAWHAGSGKCVHVVQHAVWNEQQNHPGVTPYVIRYADYLGPLGNHRGPITDGNGPLQASRRKPNFAQIAPFVAAARASWMACAWNVAIEEFERCGCLTRHPPRCGRELTRCTPAAERLLTLAALA